jgi:hypothetical protein
MDTKKVIEINHNIRVERARQIAYLKEISNYYKEIMGECKHELIVRMHERGNRKVMVDHYYCPACDAYYQTSCDCDLSAIKDSKIIDLSDVPIDINERTLDVIKKEVVDNYDKYLNGQSPSQLRMLMTKN